MATDTVRLDTAAKEKGLSWSGLVKKVNDPKQLYVSRAALDDVQVGRRGRGPDKDSAAYKAFATALAGLPQDEIDRRYRDYLKSRPKPKGKTARK